MLYDGSKGLGYELYSGLSYLRSEAAASLVLTARDQKSDFDSLKALSSLRTGATLVICPVVVVIQWVGEIERCIAKGSVRTLVYLIMQHGLIFESGSLSI